MHSVHIIDKDSSTSYSIDASSVSGGGRIVLLGLLVGIATFCVIAKKQCIKVIIVIMQDSTLRLKIAAKSRIDVNRDRGLLYSSTFVEPSVGFLCWACIMLLSPYSETFLIFKYSEASLIQHRRKSL